MKNITYGFNQDGVYARIGDCIAFTNASGNAPYFNREMKASKLIT